jgi:hypothetical protein
MGEPPSYLGRVLDADRGPVGTCFQVRSGVLVTACHVLAEIGAATVGAVVDVDELVADGPVVRAEVLATDAVHDLAVLSARPGLPTCVPALVASEDVPLDAPVVVTGHAVVDDPEGSAPRYLDSVGHWLGTTVRADDVVVGRLKAEDTMRGMSGAPVRLLNGDGVVGMVAARYNSADGWLRDSVWTARSEDVVALLGTVPGGGNFLLSTVVDSGAVSAGSGAAGRSDRPGAVDREAARAPDRQQLSDLDVPAEAAVTTEEFNAWDARVRRRLERDFGEEATERIREIKKMWNDELDRGDGFEIDRATRYARRVTGLLEELHEG